MTVGFIRISSCMIFVLDFAALESNMTLEHYVIDKVHGQFAVVAWMIASSDYFVATKTITMATVAT